jgi:hypothetical protein
MTPAVATATLIRLRKLKSASQPRWGHMTAPQMVQHCRLVSESILNGSPVERPATWREGLLKWVFLQIIGRLPRNIEQPPQIRQAVAQQITLLFEEELSRLMQTVKAFTEQTEPNRRVHPVFGPLTTPEWGRFSWIHLNHHLTQFGV